MSGIKLAVILLAGGIGKRLNKDISKQMISYNNVSILEMNIINFRKYDWILKTAWWLMLSKFKARTHGHSMLGI